MTNDEIFARIVAIRTSDPRRHAFNRMLVAFENTENKALEIRRKGKTQTLVDQFQFQLTLLKSTIRSMKENFGLTNSDIREWCDSHGYSPKLQFNLSPLS